MKKILKQKTAMVLIAITLVLSVFSCKSVQFDMNTYSPIAVVTVFGNPALPWYDPQAKGSNAADDSLPGTLLKKANQENPELYSVQDRIDSAYKTLVESLDEAGITLIDSSEFVNTDEYKKAAKTFLGSLETDVPAKDLKILDYMSGKRYQSLANAIGAQGLMFVEFTFYKQKMPSGMHDINILARSSMNVYIYDSTGKKVFHKKYTGLSESGPLDDNGSYNKHDLIALYPETVEYAVDCLVQDLLK